MRIAIIDIGSNAVRMDIVDLQGRDAHTLLSRRETTGLAGYTEDKRLDSGGIALLLSVLQDFQQLLSELQVEKTYCLATASLRGLVNAKDIVAAIFKQTGLVIRILSGEEEARASWAGSRNLLGDLPSLFVDLGGGSTELVKIVHRVPEETISLPFGVVLLYHRLVQGILPTAAEKAAIIAYLREAMAPIQWLNGGLYSLCAIGGTATALGKLRGHYISAGLAPEREIAHGYRLPAADCAAVLAALEADRAAPHTLVKLVPERLHLIFPGLYVFTTLIELSGVQEIIISRQGLRKGYLRLLQDGEDLTAAPGAAFLKKYLHPFKDNNRS
jgi:exopolyphosphatase/guanosine-5'-triphosphate,3'-diphosphate pyrophosphatase